LQRPFAKNLVWKQEGDNTSKFLMKTLERCCIIVIYLILTLLVISELLFIDVHMKSRLTFGAPHGKDHLVLDIENDGGHDDRSQHRLQQRRRS
jgi:hypothetical protein